MILDIDYLITFFQKYSDNSKNELGEQDAAPGGAPSGGSSGYPKVPKWEELYAIKVGKANPRNKQGTKWETGLVRGVANSIW